MDALTEQNMRAVGRAHRLEREPPHLLYSGRGEPGRDHSPRATRLQASSWRCAKSRQVFQELGGFLYYG